MKTSNISVYILLREVGCVSDVYLFHNVDFHDYHIEQEEEAQNIDISVIL